MIRRGLILVLAFQLPIAAVAQTKQSINADIDAIRAAIQLYISPDAAKVREAFYPGANLYTAPEQGDLRTIPVEQFLANVAKGAATGEQRPVLSIDFVDRVGNAATARVTELSPAARVTDYFSLVHSNAGWKVVSKTFNVERKAQTAVTTPQAGSLPGQSLCPADEARKFDYMVGNWTTSESPTPADGPTTGTSRTERILNGCGIWEHRYVEQKGKEVFDAHVVWGYDATTKGMLLFYIDDAAHTQLYEGKRENGGWAFYRQRPGEKGGTILIRVTYAQKGKGFTQTVERSKDQGKTWEPGSVVTYEPKA